MVTTRSKSVKKIDKKDDDRKKKVWDALRAADKVMTEVKKIFKEEDFDPDTIDMPEASLIMTALPLRQEDRERLINNAEFAC